MCAANVTFVLNRDFFLAFLIDSVILTQAATAKVNFSGETITLHRLEGMVMHQMMIYGWQPNCAEVYTRCGDV